MFLFNYHIEIIASIYLMSQIWTLYSKYFKVNRNTDNIDLVRLYVKRRGL